VSGDLGSGDQHHMVAAGSVFEVKQEVGANAIDPSRIDPSRRNLIVANRLVLENDACDVDRARAQLGTERNGAVAGLEETIKSKGMCQAVVFSFVGGTEILVPETGCGTSASWMHPSVTALIHSSAVGVGACLTKARGTVDCAHWSTKLKRSIG